MFTSQGLPGPAGPPGEPGKPGDEVSVVLFMTFFPVYSGKSEIFANTLHI